MVTTQIESLRIKSSIDDRLTGRASLDSVLNAPRLLTTVDYQVFFLETIIEEISDSSPLGSLLQDTPQGPVFVIILVHRLEL